MVFIGLIMLVGIVVKNAIVLVDRVNQLREQGVAKLEAIAQAAESRLRPIVMTTLCTLIGFLPLAIGVGEGAEVRAPMAITVIGGLAVSTLLTLLVIPVVYELLDRRADAWYTARGARRSQSLVEPEGTGARRRDDCGDFRMNLAELSLKRPITIIMLFVSMTVIGLLAATRLPLEQFPAIDAPFLFVQIPYPGSSPGEVERTITRPVEEALATLPGVKRMQSTSGCRQRQRVHGV